MTGLSDVKTRVENALTVAGRPANGCKLIAVSKVQPNERVAAVLDAGHRVFGENRVQEAQGKWPDFRTKFAGVELHLLGPLQTNKVKAALDLFDVLHSVDREKLARKIADEAQERGACPDLFIQINTGAEPQKAGVLPEEADAFIAKCRSTYALPVIGLMVIPPVDEPAETHFDMLAEIAERNGLAGLSMGMSADFETAIAHGATHVRVGSALFGARDYA